ncbi:phosphoinositide phosphatase SAC8 isoform X5 [Durio zibethinus]|uniref:Phosphoinositide phosphatase SAC8 isoform X5 n=1 Tax=Durio zibethinus TaxID=66656 RepID=A0A6P6ASE1_DURZI|nr:phosphoinositide phosphatase SAC8 isoform X5 [Durio zibethinus]
MEIGSSSDKIFKLYDQLELLEYQDKFVVKSLESPDQGFSISRREGNIETLSDASSSEKPSKTSAIYGVAGTIRLLAGTYLLVITSRKEVGSFLGFPVYRVESMKFLACNEALRFSNSQEADPRFVWNKHLLEELIEYKLDEFIIPLLQGSFQMAQLELKNSPTTCTLLSRRCTRRLGTRMWRRGANLEGDTANFIETEQLLELEGFRCSLLQIRGSIPLLWEQIVDLSYKPRLRIINHEHTVYFFLKIQHFLFLSFSLNSGAYDLTLHFQLFIQPQVVERHFHDLFQRYGETIALDLTEKHGDEGQLSAAYSAEMQKLPNVRYVSFDFHHVCGNSNFDNLGVLYDQISEDFEKQGYFLIDTDGNILEEQKGIIRSNCIDCLDRTNVTQSYLARKSLNIQLQRLGVFTSTECIPLFAEDYGKFRTLWAEQGDEISLEYAGTHALKGDLVRYGKQTVAGLIKDGMSAVSRYYLNNFHDGIRQFHVFQDALDLVSGRYTVSRNNPSPFQLNSFESFSYLPVASALLVGGLTLTTFTIQQAGRSAQHYVSSVFWAGVTAGVMALVKANGRQFCSRPRLCGLL